MTTTSTENSTLIPVLTHNGVRIPARGTIACHPSLGFGEVVTRSGSRLRIAIDVADGDALDRIAAVSAARTSGAEIEIAGLEARMADKDDAFHGAKALVNGMIEGLIARCTEPNEVIVSIDNAEAMGWEFDEFAMELPKKSRTKAVARRLYLISTNLRPPNLGGFPYGVLMSKFVDLCYVVTLAMLVTVGAAVMFYLLITLFG